MPALIDLTGMRFERLVVLRRGDNARAKGGGVTRWQCRCDCGNETLSNSSDLRGGKSTSCGCLQRERMSEAAKVSSRTHGLTDTPEWRSWSAMLSRCYNPAATGYERYGGRGIGVCVQWRHSFENFFSDMGKRPTLNHTLDRIEQNGNYTPDNCRWATKEEQGGNRRDNTLIEIDGKSMTVPAAIRAYGSPVGVSSIKKRLAKGWNHKDALTKPHKR
jgi:hypothetical protein